MSKTPSDSDSASLADYGALEPPRIERRGGVTLGGETFGYWGRTRDGELVFVTEREASDRYYANDNRYDLPFEGSAHGLDLDLFSKLCDNAGKVYVVEEDSQAVLRFSFQQFVDGHPVPEDDSVVSLVPVHAAIEVFEDHADDVLLPQRAFR